MKVLAAMALVGTMLAAGCKSSAPVKNADGTTTNPNGSVTVPAQSAPSTATAPSSMAVRNPDGSITNPDGSVTYPAGSRVANREEAPNGPPPAPGAAPVVASSSIPVPPPPAPVALTVPAGKDVSITTTERLSASHNEVGDRFTGVLTMAIMDRGETVFKAGTPVSGEVVSARGKGRFKGAGDIGISLTEIGRDRVETNVYERNSPGRGKRTAGFIGGGAGLGALIGGLAGGGKGALIGGLAGAGGGTAADAYSGNRDVVIPPETHITFRLTHPIIR